MPMPKVYGDAFQASRNRLVMTLQLETELDPEGAVETEGDGGFNPP